MSAAITPMTHVSEIGTENFFHKRHKNRACPVRYQKLVLEKFGSKLHVRLIILVTVFWYRYLTLICGKCVMGIMAIIIVRRISNTTLAE